jgi:hypothetical protein
MTKSNSSFLQHTCRNCGNRFEGNYCNICRQSAETHRITWKEIVHSIPHAMFHTDRGFIHTMVELAFRPGKPLRDYLDGKRIAHFNPFLYLILLGGLASLLFFSLHVKLPVKQIRMEAIEEMNSMLAHKYFALVGLVFILLLSTTDFIFYRNKGYLLPELIICNTFQVGQGILYTICLFPLFYFQPQIQSWLGQEIEFRLLLKAIFIAHLFFTRYQFYGGQGNYFLQAKIAFQIVLVYFTYNGVIVKWSLHYYHLA